MQIYFSREVPMHFNVYRIGVDAGMDIENIKWRNGRHGAPVLVFNGYGSEEHHSARRPNTRDENIRRGYYAATWDQWGVLLSNILYTDPQAKIGSYKQPYYAGADDFHRQTGDRFKRVFTLDALVEIAVQRWEPGLHDHVFRYDPALGGFTQIVHRCTKGRNRDDLNQCSAVMVRG